MLEKLKNLVRPQAEAGAAEHVHNLSAHARSALCGEVRFLLRDVIDAEEFPYLARLGESAGSQFSRIHFPAGALRKLAREIETVRHRLPQHSPLLKLADSARRRDGRDLVVESSTETDAMALEAVTAARREDLTPQVMSAGEQAQVLKSAAADVDVSFVSTAELGEPAQAAYYKYCLSLGEHQKIIGDLRQRASSEPRVWIWSLVLAAMRLSDHPDFRAAVIEFHIWLEEVHPETLNDMTTSTDRRKFNGERVAAVEARELAQRH